MQTRSEVKVCLLDVTPSTHVAGVIGADGVAVYDGDAVQHATLVMTPTCKSLDLRGVTDTAFLAGVTKWDVTTQRTAECLTAKFAELLHHPLPPAMPTIGAAEDGIVVPLRGHPRQHVDVLAYLIGKGRPSAPTTRLQKWTFTNAGFEPSVLQGLATIGASMSVEEFGDVSWAADPDALSVGTTLCVDVRGPVSVTGIDSPPPPPHSGRHVFEQARNVLGTGTQRVDDGTRPATVIHGRWCQAV